MNREELQELVNQKLSVVKIGNRYNCSKSTIVYWLKKFDISISKIKHADRKLKRCARCTYEKPITEFYSKRGLEGGSAYCKNCTNAQTTERQNAYKALAVEYKGGKCVVCGYNKYIGALDFHHLNPEEKEFAISKFKVKNLTDEIKKELDKCALVCANCHREIHGGVAELVS